MRGHLNDIFSCVGIGRLKIRDDGFVESPGGFGIATLRIENVRDLRMSMRECLPQSQQTGSNLNSLRSGEPDYANASTPRRS